MTYSITISDAAEKDVRETYLWYEEQQEGLGSTFEKHFPSTIDSIQNTPLKTQIRYGITRVFFVQKFPYGIHFRIIDKNILIVAVFHTSISPERWKKR